MKLNVIELKKVMYDFNSISNRLMQANFADYTDVLIKFVAYIIGNELILTYITDCGNIEFDVKEEYLEVSSSRGNAIFSLGESDAEEVRNVYAILSYIADNKKEIYNNVAKGYANSNKYQDMIKGFNDRFVMVLIRHIERYLTKIGIDMGMDESVRYSITVSNGQVNIANDNATINATNNSGIDSERLSLLINAVKTELNSLSSADQESASDSLAVIEQELQTEKPRKNFIRTALSGLEILKGSTEFGAAVVTLVTFVQQIIS
ncbi:MAG: hypothetical protein R2876_07595 [Eubacteriales bacterium]